MDARVLDDAEDQPVPGLDPVPDRQTTMPKPNDCDLCEEARITPWYYEDDDCWVAECEACDVPMIVWRRHDPNPPDDVKAMLHERLSTVVTANFEFEFYVDDNLRSIPNHYHAHARRRRRWV